MSRESLSDSPIPEPTLRRLPAYYRGAIQAAEEGVDHVSSDDLGRRSGVAGFTVRKDLSYLPEVGRPGRGYDTRSLAEQIGHALGITTIKRAVLIGAGNLGRALAGYPNFPALGLHIVALLDNDPAVIGRKVAGLVVASIESLPELARRVPVDLGIVTVPAHAAQKVADALVAAGVCAIWNFAPSRLTVPDEVLVKNEDLAAELAALSHHIVQRKRTPAAAWPPASISAHRGGIVD
ncbi:MAG: redox-sensing transcriptional repressor Rex [Anaerolineae bacterium]